jgi:hypothetical protein
MVLPCDDGIEISIECFAAAQTANRKDRIVNIRPRPHVLPVVLVGLCAQATAGPGGLGIVFSKPYTTVDASIARSGRSRGNIATMTAG